MNKIPCEVIRDLFPSYIDELTSKVTNDIIEEHNKNCPECAKILESMKEPHIEASIIENEKKEIDFLKKNKKRNRTIILGSLLAACLLVFAIVSVRFYIMGNKANMDNVSYKISKEDNSIVIDADTSDDMHELVKTKVEEGNGTVKIYVNEVLANPVKDHSFHLELEQANGDTISYVLINDRAIWDNGKSISGNVSKAYSTRHMYMGNMSDNNNTANALHLYEIFGTYKNELNSSNEPYGWKLILDNDIPSNMAEVTERNMQNYGYIILGLVSNLDEVIFEYTIDGQAKTKTVTCKEASDFLGQDIKNCYKEVSVLQSLYDMMGM